MNQRVEFTYLLVYLLTYLSTDTVLLVEEKTETK